MNKRIKELMEQSQDWADAHAPYASEEHEYFVEKFAELIVRECANIGERYADGNYEVYNQILEHFGVEQ